MKTLSFLFILYSFMGFASCSDSNSGLTDGKVELMATFTYVKDGDVVESPYTTMVLYDTKDEDTSEWVYNSISHNMDRSDGTVVYPKYIFLSDVNGYIEEEIDSDISYIYIAICGVDPEKKFVDKFKAINSIVLISQTLTVN